MATTRSPNESTTGRIDGIAVVGLSCRFPGADGPDEYWHLLETGGRAVVRLGDRELIESGEDSRLLADPDYVRAHGVLAGADLFAASFFGVSPHDAAVMDPQHRIFLECAWTAFEHAGYDPAAVPGAVGVYAGAGWNSYFLYNVAAHPELIGPAALQGTLLGNECDTLATRVSYRLGLTGPSMTVQTACSTSLTAVALACQSLWSYESDMALAGGVSIRTPQAGYLHQEGGIFSPSGTCRAFDASADGTVLGSGAGVVLLKRLDDAVADGDHIHAVIKGTAVNNDGSLKAGYAAPSVQRQAAVVREAQAMAGFPPDTITYLEAHGTGTVIGDPIEVAALTTAFGTGTGSGHRCALGSVKTNIGHLDAAAGIAGLIKTVLALENRTIPPSLGFERPNPAIDFEHSPFYVNTTGLAWDRTGSPRRAGVSSFGIGGTNVHVVLEEAPSREPSEHQAGAQILPVSARSAAALDRRIAQLREHLDGSEGVDLADVAYTLQRGRRAFGHRRAVVCGSVEDAVRALRSSPHDSTVAGFHEGRRVAFMFSGQGSQHSRMARDLYGADETFRSEVDTCLRLLRTGHDLDLRGVFHPADESLVEEWEQALTRTVNAQPALFVVEYAIARTLMHWGVPMAAGIGHSVGEYVAATLAGVFTLEDALALVVARGRLLQEQPGGAMVAVPLGVADVEPLLDSADLSVAAVNHPTSTVVAGPHQAVAQFREELARRGLQTSLLRTSHAFHSAMVEPALGPFRRCVDAVRLHAPNVPFISCVTGTWITDAQATDPDYWVGHLRERVRFSDGLERLLDETEHVLVEVGPGTTLTSLARRHPAGGGSRIVPPCLPGRAGSAQDGTSVLLTVAALWSAGVEVDWEALHHGRRRRRVPLPTYPFERDRHWIAPLPVRSGDDGMFDAAAREGRDEADAQIAACDVPAREAKVAVLEQLSGAYMVEALCRLRPRTAIGVPTGQSELVAQCDVVPAFRPLLHEWLEELDRRGWVERDTAGAVTGIRRCSSDELDALVGAARAAWADAPDSVELVQRCGAALPEVLRGRTDPVELFGPLLTRAFADPTGVFGTEYAPVIRRAIAGVLRTTQAAQGLRILEIGGGTGITTAAIVGEIDGLGGDTRHRYVFTDLSEAFVARARRRYGGLAWFTAQPLDIETPPVVQGFPAGGFDIVVAANVLHATSDLSRTLDHVRSLLAPGGMAILAEITRPTLDFAMSYSLLMGPVSDTDRSRSAPFLSREEWEQRLSVRFAQTTVVPDTDALGHHVLLSRVQGERQSPPAPGHAPSHADGRGLRKRDDVSDWFRVPSWKRTARPRVPLAHTDRNGTPSRLLVFDQDSEVGSGVVARLRHSGHEVVVVRSGLDYARHDAQSFEVRPYAVADYEHLLADLVDEDRSPTRIVHLWTLAAGASPGGIDAPDPAAMQSWRSLVALAQAIDRRGLSQPVDITVVSTGLHDVLGEHTEVEKSLLLGPCRVIPLEYPHITCRSVDIRLPGDDLPPAGVVTQLVDEVLTASSEEVVAYRGAHRWVETVDRVTLAARERSATLKRAGVYLITGGLGTIGTSIARDLVTTVGAKVVLVGRSGRLDTSGENRPWYDGRSDVLVMAGDVTDAARMRTVVETVEARWGRVDGVIHAAGVLGDGAIAHKSVEDFQAVLAPKVAGTLVLHELFKDRDLDFLVLFSSLSSRKPGFGQVAYAAANCFLDSFVLSPMARRHAVVTCINWDVWQGSGMAYDATGPEALQRLKEADFAQRGILAAQGVDAFRRVLDSGLPQVYVTSSDYLEVLDQPHRDLSQVYLKVVEGGERQHRRPDLGTDYLAPRTTTEEMLAEIWQGLLGIDRIGVRDDFFDLGGDSLLGSQFLARVRSAFGVQLPSRMLYEQPTVAALAVVVEDTLITNAHPDAIAEAIKKARSGD